MRRQIAVLLLLAGMASWCHAQNPPAEVTDMLNEYAKDSTAEFGFLEAKKWLQLDSSINAVDIEVGKPIEQFRVKYAMLDTCSDTIPFNEIIEPDDYWNVPIKAKGKYLYEVSISKASGKWQFSKMSTLISPDNMWYQLRTAYPESTSVIPMLVLDGLDRYFYFQQKGSRKLYAINHGYHNGSLKKATVSSMSTLTDSKELVKRWKKQGKGSGNDLDKIIERLQSQVPNNGGDK